MSTHVNSQSGQTLPPEQWRDKKRYLWLLGLVPPTAVFIAVGLVALFNSLGWNAVSPVWWWIGPLLVYILLPILDIFFGPDGENPPDEVMERLENDKYYRYCTYIYIPFQLASLVLACYLWSATDLSWLGIDGGLGLISKIGLAISIGCVAGIGINTAHELGHKKDDLEALVVEDHSGAVVLRPLLHRAQSWTPRAGRHARGSGVVSLRRELLDLPAAQCVGMLCARRGPWRKPGSIDWVRSRGQFATTSCIRG